MGAVGGLLLLLLFAAVALRGGVEASTAAPLFLGAAALALYAASRPRLRGASPGALGIVLAWSALALLQVLWSPGVDASLDGAMAILAVGLVFLVALSSVEGAHRERLLVLLGLGGATVAAVALMLATPETRASLPLGNPNHLAAWLLIPGGVALAGLFCCAPAGRGHGWTILWFGVFGLAAAAIAASGSRGALLAAVVGSAALPLLMFASPRRAGAVIAVCFGAATLALVIGPLWAPDLVPWARGGSEFSPGLRWMVYAASVRSALDAAPLGTGLGGFEAAFAAQRPADLPYAPRHAHSEPLHGLVELGLPLLVLAAATAVLVLRRLPTPRGRRRSLAVWGASTATLAVAAHALVDSPLHVPAIALALGVLLGLAWPASRVPAGRGPTRLVLAGLGAVLLVVAGSATIAEVFAARAADRLAEGRFAVAEREARLGLHARPRRVALLRLAAEASEHAYALGGAGSDARRRGLAAREAAVAASPRTASLYLELARARERVGDERGALAALERASALDPRAPTSHVARARTHLARRHPELAAGALRQAIERHPLAAFGAVSDFVLATGDPDLAILAIPAVPSAILGGGRALVVAGYPRQGAGVLERAFDLDPTDARTAVETARTWLAAGSVDRAAAVLSRALALAPRDPKLRHELERTLARGRGGAS